MTFVEDLQALNHLTVRGKGVSCRAQFEYGAEPDRQLPTLGPFVCHPFGGAQHETSHPVGRHRVCLGLGAAQAQSNCNLTGSSTTIDFGAVNPLLPGIRSTAAG